MRRFPGLSPAVQSLAIILPLLLAIALAAGCGGESENGSAHAEGTDADSLQAAGDSLAAAEADSVAIEHEEEGFFARFLRRGGKDDEDEVEIVPVELATVERRDVPSYLSATASLEPEKQVEIQAKASGQVVSLEVEEGDRVRQGQTLAVLDGDAQRVALEEATLRVRSLQLEYDRSLALHAEQGISDRELQDVRFRYEQADAQRKAAQLGLDHTRILAPFAGQVTQRYIDPGQHLVVGSSLFSLVDTDPLLARIHLPEKQAIHILPRQQLVINPDTRPDLDLPGEVLRIAPIVDTRTGTVKVTCQITGAAAVLKPGSFVRVRIQTDMHPDVPVIPKRALVPEGGETYVFQAVADSVIKVGVHTGYSNGRFVEITDGLALGDRVVTVGTGSLKTGSKIRELGAETAPAALADSTVAAGVDPS